MGMITAIPGYEVLFTLIHFSSDLTRKVVIMFGFLIEVQHPVCFKVLLAVKSGRLLI